MGLLAGGELEDDVAAFVGDAEVDDENVEMLGLEHGVGGFAAPRGGHLVGGLLEGERDGAADGRLVVEDEDANRLGAERVPDHGAAGLRWMIRSVSTATSSSPVRACRTCSVVYPVMSRICCDNCQGE